MAKNATTKNFIPYKIISGGQTGVDRAGLDAARVCKIKTGGYMPKNGLAEDGRVPARYNLREATSEDYAQRTILNIITSDATLILHNGRLEGGTLLTYEICVKKRKKVFKVNMAMPREESLHKIRAFLNAAKPSILNIAGPRESKSPGIYKKAFKLLLEVFKN